MESKIINYRIIIEPEKDAKTGKKVYTAFCPKLGVGDWGKTVEQALEHIKEGIQCHLESLVKHKKPIPAPDEADFMIANTQISLDKNFKATFAY